MNKRTEREQLIRVLEILFDENKDSDEKVAHIRNSIEKYTPDVKREYIKRTLENRISYYQEELRRLNLGDDLK